MGSRRDRNSLYLLEEEQEKIGSHKNVFMMFGFLAAKKTTKRPIKLMAVKIKSKVAT